MLIFSTLLATVPLLVMADSPRPPRPGAFRRPLDAMPGSESAKMMIDGEMIDNVNNRRYTARLLLGSSSQQLVNVILDTGSTDLWLDPPEGILPTNFDSSGITHKIAYADGSAYISGPIGWGRVSIAGKVIEKQAFIDVTQNQGLNECGNGICGLVGLGFDAPEYGIAGALTAGGYDGVALGKSVLTSIFDAAPDPAANRFFAFSLSRQGNPTRSAEASLAIGRYETRYREVQWMAKRPVHPPNARTWRILSDGITVGVSQSGGSIDWRAGSTSTPAGNRVVLLDTGTTNIMMRPEARDEIYSRVPGAALVKNAGWVRNTHWSTDRDVWVVPCNTPVSVSFSFNGQPYPLHPLDLTDLYTMAGPDGKQYSICVGTVTNGGTIMSSNTDAVLGDTFLRNIYTVFSFGDKEGVNTKPYVQFLTQTNEWDATQDFLAVRKAKLAEAAAPELLPAELIRLFEKREPDVLVKSALAGTKVAASEAAKEKAGADSKEKAAGSASESKAGANPNAGKKQGASSDNQKGANASDKKEGAGASKKQGANSSGDKKQGAADDSKSKSKTDDSNKTSDTCSCAPTGPKPKVAAALSDDNDGNAGWVKYAPVIIALLATNVALLLVLIALSVFKLVRGGLRLRGTPTTAGKPRYVHVSVEESKYADGDD